MDRAGAYPGGLTYFSSAPVENISVALLQVAHSPRLAGVDENHVRLLAQTDVRLPPILVHGPTMRVLDGVHRLQAAILREQETIEATFFDGSLDEGFALAVRSNVTHGLPLTLADRETAAVRLLVAFPEWSDRAIAATTGLSGGTVGSLRTATGIDSRTARVGRDGRVRPTDWASGRRRASEFIAENPAASLRQIAVAAGISPNTARAVRSALRSSDGAAVAEPEPGDSHKQKAVVEKTRRELAESQLEQPAVILQQLQRDPSLRFNESGRTLLRWLATKMIGTTRWVELAGSVPPHARYTLASLARSCANEWQTMAERLERATETRQECN
jgi:ParB-like chromosome segregation protein Spo0J